MTRRRAREPLTEEEVTLPVSFMLRQIIVPNEQW
jgi:hypothetical protein